MKDKLILSIKKLAAFILTITILTSLCGCSKNEYKSNVYDLSDEKLNLVVNPDIEFVLAALNMTESVTSVNLSESTEEGYKAKIYFTSSFIENAEIDSSYDSSEKGGSVEIFEKADEAIKRDEYLHLFDTSYFSGQSRAVVGSLVIRTSHLLDSYNQNYLIDRLVNALTDGEITDEIAEKTMSDYLKTQSGLIRMNFSSSEVLYENYKDIENKLKSLGFTNIKCETTEMDYDIGDELDECVVSLSVSGETDFSVGDTFDKDSKVVITYISDERVATPKSSEDCQGMTYSDVASAFSSAGFKNIKTVPIETAYNEADTDGGVIAVIIDDTAEFDEGDKFLCQATVTVNYVVFVSQSASAYVSTTKGSNSEKTTQKQSANKNSASDSSMVWVPTKGGTKYHSKSSCSNMKNPKQVTVSQAKSQGFTACKRCYN